VFGGVQYNMPLAPYAIARRHYLHGHGPIYLHQHEEAAPLIYVFQKMHIFNHGQPFDFDTVRDGYFEAMYITHLP
jgi:hypothetical protein